MRRALSGLLVLVSILSAPRSVAAWGIDAAPAGSPEPSVFDLIANQLPRMAEDYWKRRLEEVRRDYLQHLDDARARRESLPCLVALGQFDQAVADAQRGLGGGGAPDYDTLAVLVQLHLRRNDLAAAREACDRALAARPADATDPARDFMAMIRWLEATPPGVVPEMDYLGRRYADFPKAKGASGSASEMLGGGNADNALARIRELLRHEPIFADGHLVLGDLLVERDEASLALAAYFRAIRLAHPNPAEIERRIDHVLGTIRKRAMTYPSVPPIRGESKASARARAEADFAVAAEWVVEFKKAHALQAVDGVQPSYDDVARAVQAAGVGRAAPRDYGYRSDALAYLTTPSGLVLVGAIGLAIFFGRQKYVASKAGKPAKGARG